MRKSPSRFPRFGLIEVFIGLVIPGIFLVVILSIFGNLIFNRPGKTEERATVAAQHFVMVNKIETTRLSCAYDADNDGYGSCTAVTPAGEKLYLQCPASWGNTMMGATNCKEVTSNDKITFRR
jgi:hypothetical protein